MAILNSYVSLPEGNNRMVPYLSPGFRLENPKKTVPRIGCADYQQQCARPVGSGRVTVHPGGHFAREGGSSCLCLFLWPGMG